MLDFSSALYLGMRHASWTLRSWRQFSTGMPAALAPPPGSGDIAAQLAALQGCDAATMGTSTLHLVWDLFSILNGKDWAVYLDSGAYPILRWGVERMASRGVPVRSFAHHCPGALRQAIGQDAAGRARPLVAADGFCPGCGASAPLRAYLEIVRARRGLLVLDDTQALGIFGVSPSPDAPYGWGGGGSLRRAGLMGPDLVLVSSLAKGFGVPTAVLSGSRRVVTQFESRSETRMHCSPPSLAVLSAVEHGLELNRRIGESLRLRLARLVSLFRRRLAEVGLCTSATLFPVQTLQLPAGLDAIVLHGRILRAGIRPVLHRSRLGQDARISFLINARHQETEIERAASVLADVIAREGAQILTAEP